MSLKRWRRRLTDPLVGLGLNATLLAVSVLTFYSMTKIWSAAFWGSPGEEGRPAGRGMVFATVGVVVLSLGVAFFAQPIADLSIRAAAELLDPTV